MKSTTAKVEPSSIDDDAVMNNVKASSKTRPEPLTKVPAYHLAMLEMINGNWLNVNDRHERECNRLFMGGNVNLALICALLFTTFLPIYYDEPSRLDSAEDGLTIDIAHGYLSPVVLSRDAIHDFFDCCYLIAMSGTLFGTMVSVFYMLAGNETNDDAKTFVLQNRLGSNIAQLPFFFFSIGSMGWAIGALFHCFTVPRTAPGFYVKVIGLFAMIITMIFVAFPRMIQGTFLSRREEEENPPLYFNTDHLKGKLEEFFSDPFASKDLSLSAFLTSLCYMTKNSYRPPLQVVTKIEATCLYYEKLASITGRTVEEIKDSLSSS
jgi:hypothetical protein